MTSKKPSKKSANSYFSKLETHHGMTEYVHKQNGLRVLHMEIPGSGVITSNILYYAGSRDEMPGETGLAHMLEHMLFKPTKQDLKRRTESGAMLFERTTGIMLNANTWRERTNYFFSYPKEHLHTALSIEAERMFDVVLNDKEFLPERTNVLSEFDMYNGMPDFALENALYATALHSHPYRHEVIGFREDIAAFTVEKLQHFYRSFYGPNNAVWIVAGDVTATELLTKVHELFGHLPTITVAKRPTITEPAQEGKRHVCIERPSTTNMVAIGFRHAGFPTTEWTTTLLLLRILADGPDSILHRVFVDTGKAAEVRFSIEPTIDLGIAYITLTLSGKRSHQQVEADVLKEIAKVSVETLRRELKKTAAQIIDTEPFERDSSFGIVKELMEYVAARNWPAYFKTAEMIKHVTPAMLASMRDELFAQKGLTTAYFIGTKQ